MRRVLALLFVLAVGAEAAAAVPPGRADWLRDARWGVMVHYLADWRWIRQVRERDRREGEWQTFIDGEMWRPLASVDSWNKLVDGFDVEAFADQLQSAGVPYLVFTIGQGSGYYASPSAAYDEITGFNPSHCARRDLIADLQTALAKRGIRFIAYLPAGPPRRDEAAKTAFGYEYGPHASREAHVRWERVLREWSVRWGRRVSGWWIDGAFWPNTAFRHPDAPNFDSLAAAARAGNPDAIVCFNPGVLAPILSSNTAEDYTPGETNEPGWLDQAGRVHQGKVDGAQLHMLSYLGPTWGFPPRRDLPEQFLAWTRKINLWEGAATWDTPVEDDGHIDDGFMQVLRMLGRTIPRGDAAPKVEATATAPVLRAPIDTSKAPAPPGPAPARAGWMKDARWGLLGRYGVEAQTTAADWNAQVGAFDAAGLARQLESVGARYFFLTVGGSSGHYAAPSASYDAVVKASPSRCARRDLVSDLAAELAPRGIRLLVHVTSGAPADDATAVRALEWKPGPEANRAFRERWERVVREWSTRWGTRVAGWYFDGCIFPNVLYRGAPPNFETLAAAARAGNPDAAVAFSPGALNQTVSLTPFEDYTAGEAPEIFAPYRRRPRVSEGTIDGAQYHVLSFLGKTWGQGPPRDLPEQVVAWTRRVNAQMGAVTWDVPLEKSGLLADEFVRQLQAVKRGLAAADAEAAAPATPPSR
jgi:hypothetical protein